MMIEYTKLSEYENALSEPIGSKLKERILDHASNNPDITLQELIRLVKMAYPVDV